MATLSVLSVVNNLPSDIMNIVKDQVLTPSNTKDLVKLICLGNKDIQEKIKDYVKSTSDIPITDRVALISSILGFYKINEVTAADKDIILKLTDDVYDQYSDIDTIMNNQFALDAQEKEYYKHLCMLMHLRMFALTTSPNSLAEYLYQTNYYFLEAFNGDWYTNMNSGLKIVNNQSLSSDDVYSMGIVDIASMVRLTDRLSKLIQVLEDRHVNCYITYGV